MEQIQTTTRWNPAVSWLNKKRTIVVLLILFLTIACNIDDRQKDQNNFGKSTVNRGKNINPKDDKIKFENYIRPVLVDTAVFWSDEDGPGVKHYHINSYSEIDTANIDFYIHWYDSIVDEFNGGRSSLIFFFNDKEGTPKIPVATLVSDEGYEKHCFLFIRYERGTLEYSWYKRETSNNSW